jgi:large subunit ribosomal protein L25
MAGEFAFQALARTPKGKGEARRLRRTDRVPAIVYGGTVEPLAISLDQNDVLKRLENEAVYSHVLTIQLPDREEKAILKALQRHPSRPIVTHMDFQRVSATERIRVHVPLHFLNEATCPGVKKGGIVSHNLVDVEVSCFPQNLPEFIDIDLGSLDLGEVLHLSDIKTPSGVEIIALSHGTEHDLQVVAVQPPRSGDVTEEVPE